MRPLQAGDYVLATKWGDGDPGDHWFVGFYAWFDGDRHFVVDGDGCLARANGFRRAKRISAERGQWLVENTPMIQQSTRSLWSWLRKP